MDPLSALALSCNILDVVTAAGKTCTFLYEVHKAGTFPNHDELVSTTNMLDKSVQALTHQLSNAHGTSQTCQADDKDLLDVLQKARRLASDLQNKLDTLKLQTTDSRSKRFEKLIKTALQKGKIYDLQRRWEELRKAFDSALLVRLTIVSEKTAMTTNDRFDDLARQLTQGLSHLNTINAEAKHDSDKTRLAIIDAAESIRAKVAVEVEAGRHHTSHEVAKGRAVSKAEAQKTRQHITIESTSNRAELRNAHRSTVGHVGRRIDLAHQKTRAHLQNRLESMQKKDLDERTRLHFINSFRVPELNERRHQISEAHTGTYEWIFAENLETQYPATTGIRRSWDSFTDWLLSSSPMYWIHSKAGSGKSTLMRFMSKHEKTRELLDKWARPWTTIVLTWYFWNSGSQAQRSLKGALCALLFQLLSSHPDIATDILRNEPHLSRRDTVADWSQADLINLASNMFSSFSGHIAVFLDGLDEFDRDEDVKALFDLLHSLTKTSRVKICFSSRPERRLELELGHLPQLRLQDMTSHDMRHYITNRLRPAFPHWSYTGFDSFVEKIVHKADGVFLWVYLVTKNLQQGSLHSDSYGVLMERLELLPAKMETLYEHMWRSLNGDEDLPTYRRQAALFFSFHAHFPLSLLHFVLATDEDLCALASDMTQAGIFTIKLHKAWLRMNSLLQTRCAGLLEIGGINPRLAPWVYRQSEADLNLSTAAFETDSNDIDQIFRLSRALQCRGRVQFFHRTARDFLLDKPVGQELMKRYTLSTQDVAERLLKADLATRLSGMYHPSDFEDTESWRGFEWDKLTQMLRLIGNLDKSGADEKVAEFQYKLLQLIDTTYRQELMPKWHNFVDPVSRHNWYLAIVFGFDSPDLWGLVMCCISSSTLTTVILHNGPDDKEFATYLLHELCRKPQFMQADLWSVRVLLNTGAYPNAIGGFSPKDCTRRSPWQQFVLRFMELEQGKTAESRDQAMQGQTVATVRSFLHHGADLTECSVVVRSWDRMRYLETLSSIQGYPLDIFACDVIRDGDVLSIVNGAYLLRQLHLTIPDACREGKLEEFTALVGVAPLRQNLAIAGFGTTLYRLSSDHPDPIQETIAATRSGRRDQESVASTLAPQFFQSHRQVQLSVLLGEQACAPVVKAKIEDGQSWSVSLKWSYRHQAARQTLHVLYKCSLTLLNGAALPRIIDKALLHLSTFQNHFGLLAESTLTKHRLEAAEESFWPKLCLMYDERRCRYEGSQFLLKQLDADFHDLATMLRSHGFKNLGFTGTQFALDNEGRRIPWCSEEPLASDDSSEATNPEQGSV